MFNNILTSLKDNLFNNTVWQIFTFLFAAVFSACSFFMYKKFGFKGPISYIQGRVRARHIAKTLLKGCRPNRGGGLPTHLADRFIDIWCSSDRNPRKLGDNNLSGFYNFLPGNIRHNCFYHVKDIDKRLCELGLVKIDENNQVRPIRNWPNNLIYQRCKNHLIKYCGDSEVYYSNLEKICLYKYKLKQSKHL